MKDILANLYNKVMSFFHQTDEKSSNAKDVACNRLKLVLMQDRTNITPAIMDRMRRELIELLSKYLELDRELLDLNFEHEEDQMALMLSIPVVRAKTEEEIIEILKQEDEERRRLEELQNSDSDEEEDSESDEDDEDDDTEDESEDEDESDSDESEESEEADNEEDSVEVSAENPVKVKKAKKEENKEQFFKKKSEEVQEDDD